jgi:hypothetical protein
MTIQKWIFVFTVLALPLHVTAGQQYRQTTNDVETRTSGKSPYEIVDAATVALKPAIPVEVKIKDAYGDQSLNLVSARCLDGHVRAAMNPDVQRLARSLGVDRIVIKYDESDYGSEDATYGAITINPSTTAQRLIEGEWSYDSHASVQANTTDFTPKEWALNPDRKEKIRTLRSITITDVVKDPRDEGAQLVTFEIKSNGQIVEGPSTVKLGGVNYTYEDYDAFLKALEERQIKMFQVPEGHAVQGSKTTRGYATINDKIDINLNQKIQRSRNEDVLEVEALIANIQGQYNCFSKTPKNDLVTELNKKLDFLKGTAKAQPYPENLAPRRSRGQS